MLRTSFTNAKKEDHIADHFQIHRRFNTGVFADDYASIQAALSDASARGLKTVYLNPATVYDIVGTLNIPAGITLDGAGATIRATGVMDVMINMSQYSTVTRCDLNANSVAINGVFLSSISERLIDNRFLNFNDASGAAIKAGGALYSQIIGNVVTAGNARSLDALHEYGNSYYGINVGNLERNYWGGRGGVRFEGHGQSSGDGWELSLNGDAALQIGDNIQSQFTVEAGYFELSLGTALELIAIKVMPDGRACIRDCQIFGQAGEPRMGQAVRTISCMALNMSGNFINRWNEGIVGSMQLNSGLMVGGNYFINVDTPDNLERSVSNVSLYHVP